MTVPPSAVPSPEALMRRMNLALEAASAAGRRTEHYFRRGMVAQEQKADGSPVTIADREAEQELRTLIEGAFPSDGILGEEFGEIPGESGYRWVLDPIDGTVSFIRGVPLYGVLVAVEHAGRSVLGVIHMPALDETVYAREGAGAWHRIAGESEPAPARVSEVASLDKSLLCTTSFSDAARGHAEPFRRLAGEGSSIRGWSDCYAHLLVATGRADAAIEPLIQIWDVAPMIPIMREAGGRYTDWKGEENARSPCGLSSNGRIHNAILATLRMTAAGVD